MNLLNKIYYFWEDVKRQQTALYYMIATFLVIVALGICAGLLLLPVVLACLFAYGVWLILWIVTIPLCAGVICKLIEIVE